VGRDFPVLTIDLVRRLERLVAPEPTVPGPDPPTGATTVAQFGRTIAAKAQTGRPSNKVFCFNQDDVARLDDILAFYAVDGLEPTFYLTPAGFTRTVSAALTAAGFGQQEFEQAILYGLPSTDLSSPPRHIAIERVTSENLDDYVRTVADGFEMPATWRDAAMKEVRSHFTPDDHRFLARIDGEPAAVATLRTREGVASLGGGATVPRFRGRGCHLALIRHRLDVAYLLGCTLISSGANFGSGSFRNQLRAGLRLAYIESGWRRTTAS
jgi:acetyltransferase (GNAT) family protein